LRRSRAIIPAPVRALRFESGHFKLNGRSLVAPEFISESAAQRLLCNVP
jgi:hypothetical protein